jgi:hypothetical protein
MSEVHSGTNHNSMCWTHNILIAVLMLAVAPARGTAEASPALPSEEELRQILVERIDVQHRSVGIVVGVELVTPSLGVENGPVENTTQGTQYNYIRHAVQEANDGDTIVVAPGVYQETVSFNGKALLIGSENPLDPNVVAATSMQTPTSSCQATGLIRLIQTSPRLPGIQRPSGSEAIII